jgi:hypothetical protein
MVLTFRREGRALLARGGGRCPLRCRRQLIGDHETFRTSAAVVFPQLPLSFVVLGKPGNPRMTSQEAIPVPGFLYLASAGPRKPLPDRLISFPEEPVSRVFAA